MEERKSMGSALVDVVDAGVTLVKSEINGVARRVGDIAKAKGIGVVLLLAAVGPLVMALIFLILAVFYGLIRLGAGPWFAALLIALLSLVVTGALIFIGLKRLGAEVKTEEPLARRKDMDDFDDDQVYSAGDAPSGAANRQPDMNPGKAPANAAGQDWKISPDAPNAARSGSRPNDSVEVPRDPQKQAAGENRVVAERAGSATVRVEKGTTTVPVYESNPDGSASNYGSELNDKLDSHGHAKKHHDPKLQEPVVLKDAPGIPVTTAPTFRDDMMKGKN
ncbi:phage holin family protein [Deinococcus koreensis]|uniref:Phage holin family protein n=1 Tax=Deinococcus koreensis TaxID=2054903 RepID=A0A2K3UU87_9DEIO|nr:phage holin family protein [Deinococcus koreensis]PNY80104.1 hypothetical protein CVO96_00925 [Deinococcus koreensis]